MKFKRVVAMLLVFVMVAAVPVAAETPEDAGMLPVRTFFEAQGAEVTWNEENRRVQISIGGGVIELFPGEPGAVVNGNPVELQEGAVLWQGTAFISEDDLMTLLMAFRGIETVTLYLTEEARDLALYDFDYMVNFVLENSPWDSVVQRARGVNFEAHVANHRSRIENMEPLEAIYLPDNFPIRDCDDPRSIAANYLISLLAFDFSIPLGGIGHLGPRDVTLYQMMLSAIMQMYHDEDDAQNEFYQLQRLVEVYTHPRAVWFYGEFEVDWDANVSPFPEIPDNIVTEIIAPGEIAYLRINSFLSSPDYDDLVTLPFLREVQDFDHLIIDLRGNAGGYSAYFPIRIFHRLLYESVETLSFQFFTPGETAYRVMRSVVDVINAGAMSDIEWVEIQFLDIMSADEFIAEQSGKPYFNPEDLARLEYVLVEHVVIQIDLMPEEERVPFGGKIWLLVDGGSASASAAAALMSADTGFATVVGENTSGVMGPLHTYTVLPNTGIIWRLDIGYLTDAYGRSLEVYGVTPQIRNREGMDALETVLAIIAEEN